MKTLLFDKISLLKKEIQEDQSQSNIYNNKKTHLESIISERDFDFDVVSLPLLDLTFTY